MVQAETVGKDDELTLIMIIQNNPFILFL